MLREAASLSEHSGKFAKKEANNPCRLLASENGSATIYDD
jgi:hypothetical protein